MKPGIRIPNEYLRAMGKVDTELVQSWVSRGLLLLLLGLYGTFFASQLSCKNFDQYDEFLTIDRTLSFVESRDWWVVRHNSIPYFRKPPLQYWMGASLLNLGFGFAAALRLSPLLFALGTLLSTGLLAKTLAPEKPLAAPLAALLLSSSAIFMETSHSALLDTGLAFFIVTANLTALKARDTQVYWLWWGLACSLGALQKVPVSLLLSLPIALIGGGRGTRLFRAGLTLAVGGSCLWPAIQTARFGIRYLRENLSNALLRFTTGLPEPSPPDLPGVDWLYWLSEDNLALWIAVIVVTGWGLLRVRLVSADCVKQLFLPQFIALLLFTVGGGPLLARYLLAVSPTLIAIATALFCRAIKRPYMLWLVTTALLVAQVHFFTQPPNCSDEKSPDSLASISRKLCTLAGPNEPCLVSLDGHLHPVVIAYARIGRPIEFVSLSELMSREGPFIAIYSDLQGDVPESWKVEARLRDYCVVRKNTSI